MKAFIFVALLACLNTIDGGTILRDTAALDASVDLFAVLADAGEGLAAQSHALEIGVEGTASNPAFLLSLSGGDSALGMDGGDFIVQTASVTPVLALSNQDVLVVQSVQTVEGNILYATGENITSQQSGTVQSMGSGDVQSIGISNIEAYISTIVD